MKLRINIHNKKVTKVQTSAKARTCNSINKSKCPLNNKCFSNNVLFKSRYVNQQKSFKNRNYKTDTELSNEIWKLKEQNKNIDISWEILGLHQSYNTSTKRCMLYLNEIIVRNYIANVDIVSNAT